MYKSIILYQLTSLVNISTDAGVFPNRFTDAYVWLLTIIAWILDLDSLKD